MRRYLTKRGITTTSKALRYVERMKHNPEHVSCPGMIAVFSDADGKAATMHRTYLTEDGNKADVATVRMFMSGTVPLGGAIRLADAAETMGIAEGIETAMSASILHGMPVWATTSAQMLERWKPPAVAQHIVIFADNDESFTGQACSFALAKRLKNEQRALRISVAIPPVIGDWNDVLTGASNDAVR